MDNLRMDAHFVELHQDELEFLTDLAVNESQRWVEVSDTFWLKYLSLFKSFVC